jgi:hypothetical protein
MSAAFCIHIYDSINKLLNEFKIPINDYFVNLWPPPPPIASLAQAVFFFEHIANHTVSDCKVHFS